MDLINIIIAYKINIPLWLFISIVVSTSVISMFCKKWIENFADLVFKRIGKLKVKFIETNLNFIEFHGGIPSNIKKVRKEDNPTDIQLSFKIKFTSKSDKPKIIHNCKIIIYNRSTTINPKRVVISLCENRRSIDNFCVDKSLPVYLFCEPIFCVNDFANICKNNKVIFAYDIEDKTKTIRTRLLTYDTNDGKFPLF